jgi:DNA-binding NtrC family response regulator
MARILLTDSGAGDRGDLKRALAAEGHEVVLVDDPNGLPQAATREPPDVALLDVEWVMGESMDLIHFLKSANPGVEIITLTPIESVRHAAATILRGASLYLVEPVDALELVRIVEQAATRHQNALVVRDVESRTLEGFFGTSEAMTRLFRTVVKVAPTDATVLITGESGTGKELLAQVIHRLSRRASGKFIAVNCAAIPETLIESELFGHVKGAFTGAVADKRGLLEEADGGTVFLDEIGELAMAVQAKLLRFLQDRTVRRVGGVTSRRVDVRILAATNRNLMREVTAQRFREDLFYRLNVISLHLLPLRQRKETLPFLITHLLGRLQQRYDKVVRGLTPDAMRVLAAYDYPGNIRELENILEYAVIMAEGPRIDRSNLPPQVTDPVPPMLPEAPLERDAEAMTTTPAIAPPPAPAALKTLEEKEQEYIQDVLRAVGGNQTEAAKVLGISRTSLWRRLTSKDKDKEGEAVEDTE